MRIDSNLGTVTAVVPFLRVSDMQKSVPYYVEGLGFTITKQWVDRGKLRWCWLERGAAAIMLQEFSKDGRHAGQPEHQLGHGVSLVFICEDALAIYRDLSSRGIEAAEPSVGNGMWNFALTDPDGYRLEFESFTDVPEETKLSHLEPTP